MRVSPAVNELGSSAHLDCPCAECFKKAANAACDCLAIARQGLLYTQSPSIEYLQQEEHKADV